MSAEETDTVGAAAVAALKASSGDTGNAVRLLAERVRKEAALRHALLDPLVEYACNNAILAQVRKNRDRVWRNDPTKPGLSDQQRVAALAAGNLLMFPLPFSGKRLGEATREEVANNAEFYEGQAKDMAHKGRWLRLVAQSVPGDKTVGQALNDARLRELQQEATNA